MATNNKGNMNYCEFNILRNYYTYVKYVTNIFIICTIIVIVSCPHGPLGDFSFNYVGIVDKRMHIDVSESPRTHLLCIYMIDISSSNLETIIHNYTYPIPTANEFKIGNNEYPIVCIAITGDREFYKDKCLYSRLVPGPGNRYYTTDALPESVVKLNDTKHLMLLMVTSNDNIGYVLLNKLK